MTVDEALTFADVTYPARPHNFDALEVLAAEVRRYRAAVEKVKEGEWVTRFDVLAILEPKP